MPYITLPQTPRTHQMTFEEVLFDLPVRPMDYGRMSRAGTVTYLVTRPETIEKYARRFDIQRMIASLKDFNEGYAELFEADRQSLYHTFHIPKNSGGFRRIDAPNPELMEALRSLKVMIVDQFGTLYHTSAFAYVKGRCTVDAVKRHQRNRSNWFLKTDFSDFFGSTTEEFLWKQASMIFPFSEIVKSQDGADALRKAFSLCFLNGGLPQGTPISPDLTNLMMIPIDSLLANALAKRGFVYTRYADDILISSRKDFDYMEVCRYIRSVLSEFDAPFVIKDKKTRYGSRAGNNWNLGVMLNKDNDITIGRKNKERLKAACHNYLRDKRNGVHWDPHDIMVLRGKLSYYEMVEPDYVAGFVRWFNEKNNVNLMRMIRDDLR